MYIGADCGYWSGNVPTKSPAHKLTACSSANYSNAYVTNRQILGNTLAQALWFPCKVRNRSLCPFNNEQIFRKN